MTCPHCGADLPAESVSCPGCGRPVAVAAIAPEPVRRPDRRALMRWSMGIYIASYVLLLALIFRAAGMDGADAWLGLPLIGIHLISLFAFCITYAQSKGRSAALGVAFAFCLPPVGLLLLGMLPSRVAEDSRVRLRWRDLPVRTRLAEAAAMGLFVPVMGVFLAVILPANPNSSARGKIFAANLDLWPVRQTLRDQCEQGSLAPGVTDVTPADADKPGRYLRNITVRVDDPKRPAVIATLKDIYSDVLWWKRLDIPAGTTMVFQGQCEDRRFAWKLTETGVPNKYLPSNLRLPAN